MRARTAGERLGNGRGRVCRQAFGGPRGPGRRCWPGQPADLLQPLSGPLAVLARPALNA